MSETHTAGPWVLTERNSQGHRFILEPSDEPGGGPVIAELWDCEHDADARLIAAAPRMLEALRKCLPVMEEWQEQFDPTDEIDVAVKRARDIHRADTDLLRSILADIEKGDR